MNEGFDPDAYLLAKQASSGFDPDAYLATKKPRVSGLESGLRGAGQGFSLDFGDEITGGAEALWDKAIKGDKRAWSELYTQHRDEARKANADAEAANPGAYLGGQLVGGIAPLALTGGTSLPAMAAVGAGAGALQALGDAKELDSGAIKDSLKGAALGGALGTAGWGVGKLAGKALGGVGRWADEGFNAAEGRSAGLATKSVDEGIGTARGRLGGETQKGNRMVETIGLNQHAATPEQQAILEGLQSDGTLEGLKRKLLGSNLRDLPGQAGVIDARAAEYQALLASRDADIAAKAAAISSPEEAMRQIGERVKRYAPPILGDIAGHIAAGGRQAALRGVVGAGAGLAMGGDITDAGLGALAGAGMRPAMHAIRRMAQHPSVAKPFYSTIQRLATSAPQALGRWAKYLVPAAAKGSDDIAITHMLLAETDPAYQEHMLKLAKLEEQGGNAQ